MLFIYFRALGRGQTWGMRFTNIKLVRSDNGMPAGFGKALGRTLFANIVSAKVFYLGYLWAAWDDRKQTWQDKIVSSYVVRDLIAGTRVSLGGHHGPRRLISDESPSATKATRAHRFDGLAAGTEHRFFDLPVRTLDRPNGALCAAWRRSTTCISARSKPAGSTT